MSKQNIYLDHAAATPVDPRVVEAMQPYFSKEFGNPSSFNSYGVRTREVVENSRKKVAQFLNCSPEEIIFTGSGTESINLAIKGIAFASRNKGKHIITQKTEHKAVLESCKFLEKEGFEVMYLDVDEYGKVNPKNVETAIRKDTILISIMYANNEIGTIQPIKEISSIAKSHGTLFHTDACQATGYLEMDVQKLGVDLLSINGSKIYGPKGIGCLYLRRGLKLEPIIHGGGQERGLHSGTENVPAIVGFAKALELARIEQKAEDDRLTKLRDKLINGILEKITDSRLNGHPNDRLPNNVNVSFKNIQAEALLLKLDEQGIYASSGSACTSQEIEPSHVIRAIKVPQAFAKGTIRFSLGKSTTENDIDNVLEVLTMIVGKLRHI